MLSCELKLRTGKTHCTYLGGWRGRVLCQWPEDSIPEYGGTDERETSTLGLRYQQNMCPSHTYSFLEGILPSNYETKQLILANTKSKHSPLCSALRTRAQMYWKKGEGKHWGCSIVTPDGCRRGFGDTPNRFLWFIVRHQLWKRNCQGILQPSVHYCLQ